MSKCYIKTWFETTADDAKEYLEHIIRNGENEEETESMIKLVEVDAETHRAVFKVKRLTKEEFMRIQSTKDLQIVKRVFV